ncbi:MAG: hypothetical protein H6835_17290 [Planctomycetes bacterium]|nr:hypothetical protein [Planctomycetota bacterium]
MSCVSRNGLCAALALGVAVDAAAQHPLADLSPAVACAAADAAGHVELNGLLYFVARSGPGVQTDALWCTDGTAAGTHRVALLPFAAGPLTAFAGRLWFAVGTILPNAIELWCSDGTAPGTAPFVAARFAEFREPTVLGNELLFVAGHDLLRTDGVAAPTVVHSWPWGPRALTSLGSRVLLVVDDGASGRALWQTDGVTANLLLDINPSGHAFPATLGPGHLHVDAGVAWFVADDGVHGREPWRSDGTPLGTAMVADLAPGSASSMAFVARNLAAFGGAVYAAIDDGSSGAEPWRLHPGPPQQLVDLRPGAAGSSPAALTELLGELYFVADDGVAGRELWTTFTMSAQTLAQVLPEPLPGAASSFPAAPVLTAAGPMLYYETAGAGLWRAFSTSGAAVVDGVRGAHGFGTDCVFSGPDGEPRVLTPAASTPIPLGDVNPDGDSSWLGWTAAVDGLLFFAARMRSAGPAGPVTDGVFVTDGATVTQLPNVGFGGGAPLQGGHAAVRGRLVFAGRDAATNLDLLHVSDGTAAGTGLLLPLQVASVPGFVALGDFVVFVAAALGTADWELWRTDGTAAGTYRVVDLAPGSVPGIDTHAVMRRFDRGVVFSGRDSATTGFGLWFCDGTAASARLLLQEHVDLTGAVAFGARLWFVCDDGMHGAEPWSTDGTAAGTAMIHDVRQGPASSTDPSLAATAIGPRVVFWADDGVHGREPWSSDGTQAGTGMVAELRAGADGSWPGLPTIDVMVTAGDRAWFVADDGAHGVELWSTDGVATASLHETAPGAADGVVPLPWAASAAQLLAPLGTGDQVVFLARDGALPGLAGAAGSEPWVSDGTSAGTHLLADLAAGPSSSWAHGFVWWRSRLLVMATDGAHGLEPWSLPLAAAGASVAAPVGYECAGTAAAATALGQPVLGNAGFALQLGAGPNALAALFGGAILPGPVGLDGCAAYLQPAATMLTVTDASGAATGPMPVPNAPSLIGAEMAFQWLVAEAAGPVFGVFAASNGVFVLIGD